VRNDNTTIQLDSADWLEHAALQYPHPCQSTALSAQGLGRTALHLGLHPVIQRTAGQMSRHAPRPNPNRRKALRPVLLQLSMLMGFYNVSAWQLCQSSWPHRSLLVAYMIISDAVGSSSLSMSGHTQGRCLP
jgi:hypothetical protein